MGTRIANLPVTKVVDGDTVKVLLGGVEESLRLACVDTEESLPGSDKPVTEAGKAASAMAKAYFAAPGEGPATVDLEFDTDDPVDVGQARHRDNFGRLLCYLHKGGENYNLKLVREGWSPYFVKYGRSRQYHEAMTRAEADAQANNRVVWDPQTNGGGPRRDYPSLLAWWGARDSVVEEYRRHGVAAGALSVRLDYERLAEAARDRQSVTVFCDLQEGIQKWTGGGALIYAGSIQHRFNLWIPDADTAEAVAILRLVERRYAGQGRGYVYVRGTAELYRATPQIVLADRGQLSDFPPA